MKKRTAILEIRPGEGGIDAANFADELATAFIAFARRNGDKVELSEGGARTTKLTITGSHAGVYEGFAGVHRVQRMPPNGKGKRHTSTATVAVLSAPTESTFKLNESDLIEKTFRASGNGGQNVQKTSTGVKLQHIPTGLVVMNQDERSQWQNRQAARKELARRLSVLIENKANSAENGARRLQISDGNRAAKQFTHDQRGTITDHQSGRKWQQNEFLKGRIE